MPINRNQVTATANGSAVTNNIALSQTLGAAGLLTLNGTLAAAGPPPFTDGPASKSAGPVVATLPLTQPVVITSAGNDSGITFTITGIGYSGAVISEVLTGANAGPATSALQYKQVTSIRASAATAAGVVVGTGVAMYSPWLIVGPQRNHFEYLLRSFIPVGSTGNYDLQATSDPNIMRNTGGFSDDTVTLQSAQTGNLSSYNNAPWMAFRLKVNTGGPVNLRMIPSRTA